MLIEEQQDLLLQNPLGGKFHFRDVSYRGALEQSVRLRLNRFSAVLWAVVLPFAIIAVQAQAKKATDDQERKESYAYVLTMDKIYKLGEVRKSLNDWLENNKQTSKKMDEDKSLLHGTLAHRARTLDINYPQFAAIIHKEGLSTREYLLATHVLLQSIMLADAKKEGDTQDYSKCFEDVSAVNLEFVEQHLEEIRKNFQDTTRMRM